MMKVWGALRGRKSYLVALVTIVYAVVVIGWGGSDWNAAAELVLAGLGLGALRHGIK